MSNELKPCPLCGSAAMTFLSSSDVDEYAGCSDLSCPLHANAMASLKWNTRLIEDALRAEVERLTAENAGLRAKIEKGGA